MSSIQTIISNILVIGSGGAGLRAAIEAKLQGLDVSIIGKRFKKDVHTSLAAGGINASLGNVDSGDSWTHHFVDTYREGYQIANPAIVEIMVKEAPEAVLEIDSWGANFKKLTNGKLDQRYFGAHSYRRTCYCGDYTGKSILNALLNKARTLKLNINDHEYVTSLLVKENVCFGAISFNINNGTKTIYYADSVILATGGHTRIWSRSSSRKNENNGDGLLLALKAGCQLSDMEMVQFHPTGMLFPDEYAGLLVTEAVRGEGGRLFNVNGDRFMEKYDSQRMELSTRDKIAVANYIEIKEGRGTSRGGVLLDISHRNKEFILEKLPNMFRQFLDIQMLDISKSPMEVAPTAHYSMGGIVVETNTHMTNVNGLYACGEVSSGLHGANRLGGNSLTEILVFGKKTGLAASEYSKNLKFQFRDREMVEIELKKIDKFVKKGNFSGRKLEHELQLIMWDCCGVLRNKTSLMQGLNEIKNIKSKLSELDVNINSSNYDDLVTAINLKSSVITAEATILSALSREESRGSHQRSDFPKLASSAPVNYYVEEQNGELIISSKVVKSLNKEINKFYSETKEVNNFKNKLLE